MLGPASNHCALCMGAGIPTQNAHDKGFGGAHYPVAPDRIPPGAIVPLAGVLGIAVGVAKIVDNIDSNNPITGDHGGGTAQPPIDPDGRLRTGSDESSEVKGGVYSLRDSSGQVVRTGRTNDLARRRAEHGRDPNLQQYQFRVEFTSDGYDVQRGLEQLLHNRFKPELNRISPISPLNPKKPRYMRAADEFLKGYPR